MALQIADYHILKTLYSNANTIVVRAEDRKTHETVILKHLTVDAVNNNQLARFAFSYDVLSKFNHANVIKPIRWIDDGHGPTMAMEDINGIDLHQYAAGFENKQLPVIPFLTLAIQLADGLGEIHHAQVIHKDLHPGNIIVTPDQENARDFRLQIIDFGLASLLTREQPSLAAPDKLEGILAYISPEQTGRMNRALDYRTDFYSLGVILYQLLTGTLPYTADNAMSWVYAHIARPITPVTKIRNDVPPLISAIIDKLLAKNAEDRYQSAWGLRHDLENCLRSLESGSMTPSFPLGQTDISDHLHIPQILYGRQDEIRQLLSTFTEATEGTPQLLVVTGNAGIGKSALIHEIHKPIAEHDGLFISGKFDQFQKNIPYSALKQALQQWLQQQLTKSDNALEQLKRKLTLHLGNTARLMIEFMGELRHVLEDNLPEIPELVPVQSEVRLKTTVSRLVQFIAMAQPLVLFIDDLQWADRGTLSLLPELLQPIRTQHHDTTKLMVIVAYRDNEVDQSHPTTLTLTQIEQNKNPCTRLCLAPLPPGHIVKMLEDSLHLSSVTVSPLADLVYRKTAGNPFFINEFLRSLYHDGELRFNLRKQRWDWDLEAIRNTVVTDNVVDLMLHKMTHLPKVTRELLQMASCLGSRFDLDILARLAQRSIADITRELWPALKAGLLLQEGGEWSLGSISEQVQGELNYDENRLYQTQISPLLPHCRFLHDRMLQAAYESIAKPKQLQLHLAIGRVLLDMAKKSGPQKSTGLTDIPASQLYEVVEHLNQAQSLQSSEPDFLELAELNMQASLLAKDASVWSAALTYAQAGNQQLHRTTNQPETLQFQLQLMELDMLFMNGKREKALSLATDLEHMTSNRINKARVCCSVVTNALTSTFEMIDKLLEKGIDGLRHCDQTVPGVDEIDDQYIERLYRDVRPVVNKKIEHLVVCREEENPRLNLIFRLFAQLGVAAQVSGRQSLLRYCCLKGAQIAFQEQITVRGIVLLAFYSVLLSRRGDHQEARTVAEKVMAICHGTPDCPDIPMIYNCLGAQNWHCYHPLQEAISVLMNAHQTGYEYGDLIRGVFAGYSNSLISRFSQGTPFSALEPHFNTLFLLKDKLQMSVSAGSYYARLIAILSAQGNANLLTESAFDAKEWQLIQNSTLLGFIHHLQLQQAFWQGDMDAALTTMNIADTSAERMAGYISVLEQDFLSALIICHHKQRTKVKPVNTCSTIAPGTHNDAEPQAGQIMTVSAMDQRVSKTLKMFEQLCEYCPENFRHKLYLLQAEWSLTNTCPDEQIMDFYELAITDAAENGFIQFEAYANQRYGEYWLSLGRKLVAKPFLQRAQQLFALWGCEIRVQNLARRYENLLLPIQNLNTRQKQEGSSGEFNSGGISQEGIDLIAIMQSARSIASELSLDVLITKVMGILLENAGAQRGALIRVSGEENDSTTMSVNAWVDLDHDGNEAFTPQPLVDFAYPIETP